jgi:hypothetical protein
VRRVILESPYAGNIWQRWRNRVYARRCVRDSLLRGEAPIASHLLYTQRGILDDGDAAERKRGIEAGLAWRAVADASVVYIDRGVSDGMRHGIEAARAAGIEVEFRALGVRIKLPSAPGDYFDIERAITAGELVTLRGRWRDESKLAEQRRAVRLLQLCAIGNPRGAPDMVARADAALAHGKTAREQGGSSA